MPEQKDRTVFEYSHGARIAAVVGASLMWSLLIVALGGAVALLVNQHPIPAVLSCAIGLLLAPYCLNLQQSVRLKHEWRVSLRRGHATLFLPAHRASHYRAGEFEGEVNFREIDAIVRRRESYSRIGPQAETMPYWLILKDGRKLLLGEDRNPGDGNSRGTSLTARAAEAISVASGIPITRFEPAEGRTLLGLFVMRPPSWPMDA